MMKLNILQNYRKPLINLGNQLKIRNIHVGLVHNSNAAVDLSYTIINPDSADDKLPPFLITHGLLGCKTNWNSIAKAVAKSTNRKVITFDARNHGDSPQSEAHNYDLMAQDVIQLTTKTLKLSRFSFMGHSMGGRTAMVLALRYPDVFEKVVVVDVSPVSMQSKFHSEMKSYLQTMMSINFNQQGIKLSEARKIGDEALKQVVSEASVRAFLLTNLAQNPDDGSIFWKPNLGILLQSVVDSIGKFPSDLISKQFKGPVLFIRGEKSSYVQDKDVPKIIEMFPSAKIDTIPGSGHWPHSDNSTKFLNSLLTFLKL